MKKVLILFLLTAFLAGCSTQETFETVDDLITIEPAAAPLQFVVSLPEEAAAPTFEGEDEELYICQGYTISKQIFQSGDLEKTIKTLTGKSKEELDVIKTLHDHYDRYDFVWTSAGEEGLQLGRACILDDGNYHYTLTTQSHEEDAGTLRETFGEMFDSCKLLAPDINLSTGS